SPAKGRWRRGPAGPGRGPPCGVAGPTREATLGTQPAMVPVPPGRGSANKCVDPASPRTRVPGRSQPAAQPGDGSHRHAGGQGPGSVPMARGHQSCSLLSFGGGDAVNRDALLPCIFRPLSILALSEPLPLNVSHEPGDVALMLLGDLVNDRVDPLGTARRRYK